MLTHVNAYEVFSPEIVEEIQKYYSGGYLWIPIPEEEHLCKRITKEIILKKGE